MTHLLGIKLLLAPHSSRLAGMAADVAQSSDAIMIDASNTHTALFADRSRVFGVSGADRLHVPPLLDAMAARGARTLAYVEQDSPGPKAFCGSVLELSRLRGIALLSGSVISASNVQAVVRRLVQEDPEVVLGCVHYRLCRAFLLEAHRQSLNPKAFAFPLCTASLGFEDQAPQYGQHVIGLLPRMPVLPVIAGSQPMGWQEFRQRWKEYFQVNQEPTHLSIAAFSACAALMLAVQRVASGDPTLLAAGLNNLTEFSFDSNGQGIIDFDVVQYLRGELAVVAPPERATHELVYPRPRWQDWRCYDENAAYSHIGILTNLSTNNEACAECTERTYSEFDSALGQRVCKPCLPGQALITTMTSGKISMAICSDCHPGTRGDRGACHWCPEGKHQSRSGQVTCVSCPAGKFARQPGAAECTSCASLSQNLSTTFYTSEAGSRQCHMCPEGAICEKDSHGQYSSITNEDNHFLFPSTSPDTPAKVYRCPYGRGHSCLSHGRCYEDVTGEETMEGPLCGKCRHGFGRVSDPLSLCERCDGLRGAVLGLVIQAILALGLISALMLMIRTTDFSRPRHLVSIIVRQFTSYAEMSNITTANMSFESSLIRFDIHLLFEQVTMLIGMRSVGPFAMHCLAWEAFSEVEHYKILQVLGLTLVPCTLVFLCGGFMLSRWLASSFGWPKPSMRMLATLIIVTLFVMLPLITHLNLSSLFCYQSDVQRLALDPTVECNSPEHWKWQAAGGLGFVIFSLGIPLGFYITLLYYKRQNRLHERIALRMIGFLTAGFEPDFWYFQCITMLRNVIFLVSMYIPGVSTDDEDRNKKIQSTVLVFISGGFLSLHLFCQPYDKRGYDILDKIEGASLLANLMTPLLQLCSLQTDTTPLFVDQWTRQVRDGLCLIVIACLHGRVVVLVLWGVARSLATWFIWAPPVKPRLRRSMLRLVTSKGKAKVLPNGIEVHGVRRGCEKLLCNMIEQIVRLHLAESGTVTFEGIAASMQRVIVETQHAKELETFQRQHPIVFFLTRIKRKVEQLPVGKEALRAVVGRLERYFEREGWDASCTDRSLNFEGLATFDRESVVRTYGEVFTIEELHDTLLRLRNDAYQLQVPVRPATVTHEERFKESFSSTSSSKSSNPKMQLSRIQILDSELRVKRQENVDIMLDLESKIKDSNRLHAARRMLEIRLAEVLGEIPQETQPDDCHRHNNPATTLEISAKTTDASIADSCSVGLQDSLHQRALVAREATQDAASSHALADILGEVVRKSTARVSFAQLDLAALVSERNRAHTDLEKVDMALDRSRTELGLAHMELERQKRCVKAAEARLALLEAENTTLHGWADRIPNTSMRVEDFDEALLHTLQGTNTSNAEPLETPHFRGAFLASCSSVRSQI